MISGIIKYISLIKKNIFINHIHPDGGGGVDRVGHRGFIGELWEVMGPLQFEFLKSQGLLPNHIFCDIASGSFRLGRHMMPYLDEGNYLAIELEQRLIDLGLEKEIGEGLFKTKKPEILCNGEFRFDLFSKKPKFGIAQSLFTHLNRKDIYRCLKNFYDNSSEDAELFATFSTTPLPLFLPFKSHAHRAFNYTVNEMKEFGHKTGWKTDYIGDWRHPRGQKMMKFYK